MLDEKDQVIKDPVLDEDQQAFTLVTQNQHQEAEDPKLRLLRAYEKDKEYLDVCDYLVEGQVCKLLCHNPGLDLDKHPALTEIQQKELTKYELLGYDLNVDEPLRLSLTAEGLLKSDDSREKLKVVLGLNYHLNESGQVTKIEVVGLESEDQRNYIHEPEDHHFYEYERVDKPARFKDFLESQVPNIVQTYDMLKGTDDAKEDYMQYLFTLDVHEAVREMRRHQIIPRTQNDNPEIVEPKNEDETRVMSWDLVTGNIQVTLVLGYDRFSIVSYRESESDIINVETNIIIVVQNGMVWFSLYKDWKTVSTMIWLDMQGNILKYLVEKEVGLNMNDNFENNGQVERLLYVNGIEQRFDDQGTPLLTRQQ